jgi:hypothetical protein
MNKKVDNIHGQMMKKCISINVQSIHTWHTNGDVFNDIYVNQIHINKKNRKNRISKEPLVKIENMSDLGWSEC